MLIGNKHVNLNDYFTGAESAIESIDLVQIISAIEEKLESYNIEGYDLFEAVFNLDKLTFEDLSELIENDLKEFNHVNYS